MAAKGTRMQPQIHTPDDLWTIARRMLVTRKELRQMTLEMEKELERIQALRRTRNLASTNPAAASAAEQSPTAGPSKAIADEIRKVIEILPPLRDKRHG